MIVELTTLISLTQEVGISFRGFQHIKVKARFVPNAKDSDVYLDPESLITLEDQSLLRRLVPDFKKRVQQRASPVPVRDYNNKVMNAIKFIVLDLYFSEVLSKDELTYALTKVQIKIHLTKDLKANMLINIDVLISNRFLIDYASQSATISAYQNVKIAT